MSAFFQPGSMSADLVVHREIDERIQRARALEMVRMAQGRPERRVSLAGRGPARFLSVVRVAARAPFAGLAGLVALARPARPAAEG